MEPPSGDGGDDCCYAYIQWVKPASMEPPSGDGGDSTGGTRPSACSTSFNGAAVG